MESRERLSLTWRYLPVRGEAGAIRTLLQLGLVQQRGHRVVLNESVAFAAQAAHDTPLGLAVPTLEVADDSTGAPIATIQHAPAILSFLADLVGDGLTGGSVGASPASLALSKAKVDMVVAEASAITQLHLNSDLYALKREGLIGSRHKTASRASSGGADDDDDDDEGPTSALPPSALAVAEALFFRTTLLPRLAKLNDMLPRSGKGPSFFLGSPSSTLTVADIAVHAMLQRLNADLKDCVYTTSTAIAGTATLVPSCHEVARLVALVAEIDRRVAAAASSSSSSQAAVPATIVGMASGFCKASDVAGMAGALTMLAREEAGAATSPGSGMDVVA